MKITTFDQLKSILEKIEEPTQVILTYATDSGLTSGFSKTDLSNTKLFKIVERHKVDFNKNYVQTIKDRAVENGNENPEYNITDRGKQINSNYTWVLPNKIRKSTNGDYYFVYYPISGETAERVTTYGIEGIRNTTKLNDMENIDSIMARSDVYEISPSDQKIIDSVSKPKTTVSKPQSDMGLTSTSKVDFRMLKLKNILELELNGTIYEIYIR